MNINILIVNLKLDIINNQKYILRRRYLMYRIVATFCILIEFKYFIIITRL